MEIVSTGVYVGPNVFARRPLIRLTVDFHRRAGRPVSDYADDLVAPLLTTFPASPPRRPSSASPSASASRRPSASSAS